jgi:hypothetical protein
MTNCGDRKIYIYFINDPQTTIYMKSIYDIYMFDEMI